jgi:hypothetical protein
MPAYIDQTITEFLACQDKDLLASLHIAYSSDGFLSQYTSQSVAWERSIPLIKSGLIKFTNRYPTVRSWRVIMEMPLYRLRRRIDLLVVCPQAIAVVELKVGESSYLSTDAQQVEEYALDLRDFHEPSHGIPIIPVLWCTEAENTVAYQPGFDVGVAEVVRVGTDGFENFLLGLCQATSALPAVVHDSWSRGAYKPVPSVIEAATSLFSGHGVSEIAQADAANLDVSAECIFGLIKQARDTGGHYLIFLTGVPGSGKTLAGLQVVHRAEESNSNSHGDVVYLSGNTPLVTVLREALTEDDYKRQRQEGLKVKKGEVRTAVRARIQHIMDFLREYLNDPEQRPPHERAIVFDEAQRAWNADFGKKKFNRSASEPRLLMDIMGRHSDWSVIVGLIGGGQEINTGENGMAEWGEALRGLPSDIKEKWSIFGPVGMASGIRASAFLGLGDLTGVRVSELEDLVLNVPLRSFRSPLVSDWVAAVLDGDRQAACTIMRQIDEFPIVMTRDSSTAKDWLRKNGRGERRFGLVASSTATRLRAEGYGVSISAGDGSDISNWYLSPQTDIRSSYYLEVLANEYTTQGLELDFVGLCWGGDLLRKDMKWQTRKFSGTKWTIARNDRQRFIMNSYRVLMTRAREGVIIWVPRGNVTDSTRSPADFDHVAQFLGQCGVRSVD